MGIAPRNVIYYYSFPKSKLLHGCAEFAEEMEWSRGESTPHALAQRVYAPRLVHSALISPTLKCPSRMFGGA